MPKIICSPCIENLVLSSFFAFTIPIDSTYLNHSSKSNQDIITLAQIVPDQTLGVENSVIDSNVDIEGIISDQIRGGAIRGENLFHSFKEFNVSEGQGAYFVNPAGIEYIFSRVTGNNNSQILGKLGVLGNADLFLINPNGIIFGSNATLDLKGSFLATTANSISFEDGTLLDATESSLAPLLTVSIPTSLEFRESPGSILNQSQAELPTFGIGLQVQPSKTLALLGGNIRIVGNIIAPRANIEIGSIAKNSIVHLQPIDSGWSFDYDDVQNFDNIEVTDSPQFNNFALISTAKNDGIGGGSIQVRGKNIALRNGSQINGFGTDILINASNTLEVSGPFTGFGFPIPSAIVSQAPLSGKEGDVTIIAKNLIVQNQGRIISATSGLRTGENFENLTTTNISGGNLIINAADSVELIGGEGITGLFSDTNSFGDAGNITIDTAKLSVHDGAIISVESTGLDALDQPIETGAAGNIIINANSLTLNQGFINAETSQTEGNEGANITFNLSEFLRIENESLISAQAFETATGGNIDIDTKSLIAFPPEGQQGSDIIANASEGRGGEINISAQGIFGIEQRNALEGNQTNDIDASSEFGLDGVIEINQPDLDPNRGLIELPETVVDPNALITQNPCKRGSESEFVISEKGGLPPSIGEDLSSDATQVGLVEPAPMVTEEQKSRETEEKISSPPLETDPIIPAQGWVFNERGEVVLVAYNPAMETPSLKENSAGCTVPN